MTTLKAWPADELVDPAGAPNRRPTRPAPRDHAVLGGRVLLLDNGKLKPEYGNLHAIFDVLRDELQACDSGAEVLEHALDLVGVLPAEVRRLVDRFAADGVSGCVIALCDSGVTQPSVMTAAEFERAGVPTVLLCKTTASRNARASATAAVPGLPVVAVDVTRMDTAEDVADATRRVSAAVLEGLSEPPDSGTSDTRHESELPSPSAATIRRTVTDPGAPGEQYYEWLVERHMSDGLPVILPTRDRVERMLEVTDEDPDAVLVDSLPIAGRSVTVTSLAAAAVMAGCRPEYFPITLAAMKAMASTPYRLFQAVVTSHPGGNAVIVCGPLAAEIGMASGAGCLGPGFRANATIGRAVNLCLACVGRLVPGESDLAVFGSPAEYSFCMAESAESPWSGLHEDLFDAASTVVLVHRCEGPHNVIDHQSTAPEPLLESVASVAATLGGNNAYAPAELLVFLSPDHVEVIAGAGWSKRDVQLFLFERARNPAGRLVGRGISRTGAPWMRSLESVPVVDSPDDVIVIVGGGSGPQSMVGKPWGFARAVARRVEGAGGQPIRCIDEARALGQSRLRQRGEAAGDPTGPAPG